MLFDGAKIRLISVERNPVLRKRRIGIIVRSEERRLDRQDHLHVIVSVIGDTVKIIEQFTIIGWKWTLIKLGEISNPIAVYKVDRLHVGVKLPGRQASRKRLSTLIVHASKT